MNLSFKRKLPDGSDSHFIEKIWAGFAMSLYLQQKYGTECCEIHKARWPYSEKNSLKDHWWSNFMKAVPKITSIRDDNANRWIKGKKIHFSSWKGKPYNSEVYSFAPVAECLSTQMISIRTVNKIEGKVSHVYVDGRLMADNIAQFIAVNDGFLNKNEMVKYLGENYIGKIIHWTDLKY